MKKLLSLVLIAAALVLSVAAANAPLTAAEYAFNDSIRSSMTEEDGVLSFYEAEALFPNYSEKGVYIADSTGAYTVRVEDENAFDIVAEYTTPVKPVSGYELELFFNPERVSPILTGSDLIYGTRVYKGTRLRTLATDALLYSTLDFGMLINQPAAVYSEYVSTGNEAYLNSYLTCNDDGQTNGLFVASGDAISVEDIAECELMRWPFKLTDTSDNWYRTKISGTYSSFDQDESVSLYPILDGDVYYYNENYSGPTFDILDAEKREEGEIRFKSVYFSGLKDVHDNHTWIEEVGVVLYPTELLENEVLTLETEDALKIRIEGYYDNSTPDIVYTGVLTGLENYEDMYITAKSYVTYIPNGSSESITVYSDPIARSYEWCVAMASGGGITPPDEPVDPISGMFAFFQTKSEATAEASADWLQ